MDYRHSFLGESAALGAAFLWASASVVYARLGQALPPVLLNILKGLVAIVLLLLTLGLTQTSFSPITTGAIILLVISGILGIGIGDTAYFSALRSLGARRTLLLETLAPAMTAILALIFLGENLNLRGWAGISVTLMGVAWVITQRTHQSVIPEDAFRRGILWAMVAAFAQAAGAVLSRSVLMMSDISPLWTALVRLLAGTATALVIWPINSYFAPKILISWSSRLLAVIVLTAFASTYLGIWLQQVALKFAPAGIAQTLSATSPLFVLPMVYFLGETVDRRGIIGVLLAIVGISILFLG